MDLDRFVAEMAEVMCTKLENCDGDYGIYEGPDHAGCVANAEVYYRENQLSTQQAEECGDFDACTAEQLVNALGDYAETCEGEGFVWDAYVVYDPGCEPEEVVDR